MATPASEPTQVCPDCTGEFPLIADHFYRDRSRKTGFHRRCKACYCVRTSAYAAANRDKQNDHVRGDKVGNVSWLMNRSQGRDKVLAEIAKCDLVCANCHRIRTFERRAGGHQAARASQSA